MAGPGKYTLIWSHIDGGAISLWNFDVDKHELKEEHKTGLSQWVVPQLKRGGSARLVGLTSRTGSAEHNKALSQERANEVVRELQTQLGAPPRVLSTVGVGEQTAEIVGEPDNKENSAWRAVTVFYWRRPDPPPVMVPRYRIKGVALPLKGSGIKDGSRAAEGGQALFYSLFAGDLVGNVSEEDPIHVPIGFVVTRIETWEESWGLHRHAPKELQDEAKKLLKKTVHAETFEQQVYRFRWGPPTLMSVEVWEADAKGTPRKLKDRVTRSRAMWIYEHPDAYHYRPDKGPK